MYFCGIKIGNQMTIFETKGLLTKALASYKEKKMSIGFVPTMGALHQGHISLVERCRRENCVTVVSIFVNPTQFNKQSDLANYPRTLADDKEKLAHTGCDFLFVPSVDEMYPENDRRQFDFGGLDQVMEGVFRPGHFNGVAQIVSKLFDVVAPQRAYFGEKDFQQLAVICYMVQLLHYPVEIIACPIIRETSGLAMSSRNARLSSLQKRNASAIARVLLESKQKIATAPIAELKQWVTEQIDRTQGLEVEYFEIVDRKTLQPADAYREDALQGCVAVHAGAIRLIDNIAY
jgi:pantoate--beta-alanine ligase